MAKRLIEKENEFVKERYFVASGMAKFGGSFVNYLGNALYKADNTNAKKIKKAFPEYWKAYLKYGKIDHDKEQAGE